MILYLFKLFIPQTIKKCSLSQRHLFSSSESGSPGTHKELIKQLAILARYCLLAFFEHRNETTITALIEGPFSLTTLLTPF